MNQTAAPVRERLVHVVQGQFQISDDPGVVLTTVLGSCVAACVRDPLLGIGGMNHFLLPGDASKPVDSMKYGLYSMELLINGLKPFMNVFLVGDTTIGKNVGSISLYEPDDPKNKWGMQPIVVKSYNSANESNYSEGFFPDIVNEDNRLSLKPLGDTDEELLSLAIDHITGGSGARRSSAARDGHISLGTSADFKRGSYNLVIDDERVAGAIRSSLVE